MKSIILIMGLLVAQLTYASSKEAKIGVSGMVCGFCAQGITKKFKAEPSVSTVDVKLGEKLVTLTFKEGQDLSDDRIKELLIESGYKVEKIERTKL